MTTDVIKVELSSNYTMKKILVFLSVFLFMVSNVKAQEGIGINEKAPLFKAEDQNGLTIDLSKELEKGKVVLMFYRGQWCPYCNRYMAALQDSIHLIKDKGAQVIAVTPERHEEIDKTIEKSGASFSVIYDEGHQIMDNYKVTFTMSKTKFTAYTAYGININKASGNDDRALPVPATYIISKDGVVINRHFDTNYKSRMTIKEILNYL